MDDQAIVKPPYLWASGVLGRGQEFPYDWLPDSLSSISGVVAGVDEVGADWIDYLLRWRPELHMALVIVVTPAGATNRDVLERLYLLTLQFESRLCIRLCTSSGQLPGPTTTLCFVDKEEPAYYLTMGPHAVIGNKPLEPSRTTLVLKPTIELLDSWRTWFVWQWQNAATLQLSLTEVPALVAAKGDPRAIELWETYRGLVASAMSDERSLQTDQDATVAVSSPTEEPASEHGPGSVTEAEANQEKFLQEFLGLPSKDELFERLARIYSLGHLISVDKFSRVPPLECPAKPEWFGIARTKRVGRIKRDIKYSLSALSDEDTKTLEGIRTFLSRILPKLAFSLSDGQRWIPLKAKAILDRELAKESTDGAKLLETLINGNIEAYLKGQRERIAQDANDMAKEFSSDGTVRADALEDIFTAVSERLIRFKKGPMIPTYSLSSISIPPESASGHSSPWPQFLQLLHGIAVYPRECLSSHYFFRGVERLTEDELAVAMDIFGDHIWTMRENRRVLGVAKSELALLEQLMAADADTRQKCAWVLMVIEGRGEEVAQAVAKLSEPK